jgi:DNA-binding beta-propeller fold protein YncE
VAPTRQRRKIAGADGLFAIDTKTNSVWGSADTPFPLPRNIALTPNGKKIYVTHSGATADKVSVYTATRDYLLGLAQPVYGIHS